MTQENKKSIVKSEILALKEQKNEYNINCN